MKTRTSAVLEEPWLSKDDLAREAGGDVAHTCENTRRWAVAHPHPGPVLKDAFHESMISCCHDHQL